VDTTVSILKGVHEDKSVGDRGGMDHGRDRAVLHHEMGSEQAIHETCKILGLRADIMNELLLVGNRLPDVVLALTVIGIAKAGIDDAILDIDQQRLLTEISVLCHLQETDEFLDSGCARLYVLYLKG